MPAFAIDLTWRRVRAWNALPAAMALGAAFLVTLLAVHWPFADFLMAHGRNWFFHTDNFVYWQNVPSERFSFQFRSARQGDWSLPMNLLIAFAFAVLASFVGLKRGRWMTRVQR